MRLLADMPLLARSYNRLDVGRLHETATEKSLRDEIERSVRRARQRTSDRALPRFTTVDKGDKGQPGQRRIVQEPPLITRLPEAEREAVAEALDAYLLTLAPHWRRAIGGYTLVDVAHKVVGVGQRRPARVRGPARGQRARRRRVPPAQAGAALGARAVRARRRRPGTQHQGQRVVEYQQALQTVSDPLLGWTTVDLPGEGPLDFYVRQFRNSKGTIPLDAIDAAALTDYAGIVGHLLAKGHARTSGASMIAGYAGKGDKLGEAFGRFARAYADQTEADHALLVAAVRSRPDARVRRRAGTDGLGLPTRDLPDPEGGATRTAAPPRPSGRAQRTVSPVSAMLLPSAGSGVFSDAAAPATLKPPFAVALTVTV